MLTILNKPAVKEILSSDNAFALTLLTICLFQYPDDLLEKDPEELYKDLEEDFGAELSQESKNRIQTALLALTTDAFYQSIPLFKSMTESLNTGILSDSLFDEEEEEDDEDYLSIAECLWAIYEVDTINAQKEEFSENVSNYIDRIISSEAEDSEDVPDSVDTVEEARRLPYFEKYMADTIGELRQQLVDIGVPKEDVDTYLE